MAAILHRPECVNILGFSTLVKMKATNDSLLVTAKRWFTAELILCLRPVNERRRYFVTTSLIGWAQA